MNYVPLRFMYNYQIFVEIHPFTVREDNTCDICGGVATEELYQFSCSTRRLERHIGDTAIRFDGQLYYAVEIDRPHRRRAQRPRSFIDKEKVSQNL